MKHIFETFLTPTTGQKVYRCSICAMKTKYRRKFKNRECLPNNLSKIMNAYHAKGYTFNQLQGLHKDSLTPKH